MTLDRFLNAVMSISPTSIPSNRIRPEVGWYVSFGGHTESYTGADGRMRVRWVPANRVKGIACDIPMPGYHVNTWLIVGIGSSLGLFWTFALSKGLAARRLPVTSGVQGMIGKTAQVRGPALVFVDGSLWNARTDDNSALVPGEQVSVSAVDGLVLTVRKA